MYRSDWLTLSLWDVEVPGVRRYEHHVIGSADAAGTVVSDPDRGVLLLYRHRVLTDEWGWEIPAGMIDPGESPESAARRECVEESGWEPHGLRLVQRFNPIAGLSTQTFWIFRADTAREVGEHDSDEAERVEWLGLDEVAGLVDRNEVLDGMSLVALLQLLRSAA